MTLNEIVARVAAEKNTTPDKARRLVEADLKLAKKFYPEIKHLKNEQIITQRFASNPATSQIAAIPMLFISTGIIANSNEYSAEQIAAAAEYQAASLSIIEDIPYTDAKQRVAEVAGFVEWTYTNSPEEVAEAAKKTAGLRDAREDVRNLYEDLLAGRISVEQYSDYIKDIQHELDFEIYDDDYSVRYTAKHPKPVSENPVSDEELFRLTGARI